MRPTVKERTEDLVKRLAASPDLDEVSIFVEDGRLILEGCVGSYPLKLEAEDIARKFGFAEIDNRVRVYPCEPEEAKPAGRRPPERIRPRRTGG